MSDRVVTMEPGRDISVYNAWTMKYGCANEQPFALRQTRSQLQWSVQGVFSIGTARRYIATPESARFADPQSL